MFVFREVRAFYAAVIGKMLAKFPFDCEVLKDLVMMDLAKRDDLMYAPRKFSTGVTRLCFIWFYDNILGYLSG